MSWQFITWHVINVMTNVMTTMTWHLRCNAIWRRTQREPSVSSGDRPQTNRTRTDHNVKCQTKTSWNAGKWNRDVVQVRRTDVTVWKCPCNGVKKFHVCFVSVGRVDASRKSDTPRPRVRSGQKNRQVGRVGSGQRWWRGGSGRVRKTWLVPYTAYCTRRLIDVVYNPNNPR